MSLRSVIVLTALTSALVGYQPVQAAPLFQQGFETDTSGWLDSNSVWSGLVTRVGSGNDGIISSSGGFHAIFTQSATSNTNGAVTGPFTKFDTYRSTWPGPFYARNDIFLDTAWAPGEGFSYSVAANNTSGDHLQDFIFHVTSDTSTGQLLVAGDNNSPSDPHETLEEGNHFAVTSSGWYTFEHLFRDDGTGVLAVDLNLYDSSGNLLFTETRSTPANVIGTTVGGNRYGWFTIIDVAGGIAVDNTALATVPEPTSIGLFALGTAIIGGGSFWRRRRHARHVE